MLRIELLRLLSPPSSGPATEGAGLGPAPSFPRLLFVFFGVDVEGAVDLILILLGLRGVDVFVFRKLRLLYFVTKLGVELREEGFRGSMPERESRSSSSSVFFRRRNESLFFIDDDSRFDFVFIIFAFACGDQGVYSIF
jgi:hypothetical protein